MSSAPVEAEDPHLATEGAPLFPETIRARPPGFRFEALVAVGIVVIAALIVAWWSRDLWFFTDIWDHLAMREIGDLGDLTRDHRGHWQLPATIQTRLIHAVFGMDYWPWYHLPRAVGWGAFSLLFWWYLRRRGAYALPALGALALISFLGTSAFLASVHIGTPIAFSCLIGAALLIGEKPQPSAGEQLALFALVTLALASSVLGTSIFLAVAVMALFSRRLRRWIVPLAAGAAVYLTWFLRQQLFGATYTEPQRGLLELPWTLLVNLRHFVSDLTRLPEALSWAVLIAGLAWLVWLLFRRRLTPFDVGVIGAIVFYLAGTSLVRAGLGRSNVSMNITPLVLLVFIPHFSFRGRRWALVALTLVLGVMTLWNATWLNHRIEARTVMIGQSRVVVERMATLIAEGEPYLGSLRLMDLTNSSQLNLEGLAGLVEAGWHPERPIDEDRNLEETAIVRLKASHFGDTEWGDPPVVLGRALSPRVAGRAYGCVAGADGEPIVLALTTPTRVRVKIETPKARAVLTVRWDDGSQVAESDFVWKPNQASTRTLYLLGAEGTTVALSGGAETQIEVCHVTGTTGSTPAP